MNSQRPQSRPALSKDFTDLQDRYLNSIVANNPKNIPYRRSLSQGKSIFCYFTSESLFLLFFLTASLLVLPLVLPPLPPPPFMLLLLPLFILALLMVLALTPTSNAREVTHTYV